jgi:elongation factor 1-alpha
MITGISQADVAILVIDSSQYDGRYDDEAGDGGGICSSGNEDALLAYTFGVKQMIVVINKMDNDTVDFSEERYKTIRNDVSSFLKQVGYKPMKIPFIPISGLLGDNLISKSIHMLWYNGPSLLEALDNVNPPKRRLDKPLRIPIQDVYKIDEIRTVATGRVETGVLKPGMKVEFAPIGIIDTIETIEINNMTVSQAIPGDIVGFTVNNAMNGGNTDLLHLRRGYVTSNSDDQPAKGVSSFEAQVIIMNHPGEITNGYCPIIDCHTSHVSCVFANIKEKMDRRTGKCQEKNPKIVKTGDACIVELVPKKPLCVEPFTKFPTLGRFIVRDLQQIIAVGVVKSVTYGKVKECE